MRKKYKVKKRNGKTRYVHRIIVEKIIGRPLGRWEFVHHKDGDTLNNKPSNLMIVNCSQHIKEHMRMGWKPAIGGITSTSFNQNGRTISKLSIEQVIALRKEFNAGIDRKDLAKKYKISLTHVYALGTFRKRPNMPRASG